MIQNRKCSICKSEDWSNLDYLRNQEVWYNNDLREKNEPVGFKICKKCGFVTYDYVENERLSKHYDRERPVMSANNIVTCNRKNQYHLKFLSDTMYDIINQSGKNAKILDIGCAQGSFLNMLRNVYGFEKVLGTEWSEAFSNFGRYEYGLDISRDIDESLKYDFISYYHVLEHIQYPDEELKKIHNLLDDDGFLYIAVPLYLDILEESSGSFTVDFENLYHLNHVNVFSKQALKNILYSNGFEIIKEDDKMYGYTVLCKKSDIKDITVEEYKKVIETLERHHAAMKCLQQYQITFNPDLIDEALDHYAAYPDAYITKSLTKENMKNFDAQMKILENGIAACGDNIRIKNQMARTLFQWNENAPNKQFYSNNIKKAEGIFKEIAQQKPGNEDVYYFLSLIEAKYKNNPLKGASLLKKCIEINPLKFAECYNLISQFYK